MSARMEMDCLAIYESDEIELVNGNNCQKNGLLIEGASC